MHHKQNRLSILFALMAMQIAHGEIITLVNPTPMAEPVYTTTAAMTGNFTEVARTVNAGGSNVGYCTVPFSPRVNADGGGEEGCCTSDGSSGAKVVFTDENTLAVVIINTNPGPIIGLPVWTGPGYAAASEAEKAAWETWYHASNGVVAHERGHLAIFKSWITESVIQGYVGTSIPYKETGCMSSSQTFNARLSALYVIETNIAINIAKFESDLNAATQAYDDNYDPAQL